jgi:hypothetical protein
MRRRRMLRAAGVVVSGAVALGAFACGGGSSTPAAPTVTPTAATIDSVITTFHGALVESSPITIASPEALTVEVRLTLGLPAESKVTLYLCAMESALAVGVGTCVGVVSTVQEMQARTGGLSMGLSTLNTDGVARTTHYVYVGLVEGAFPWSLSGSTPPQTGDRFGSNRVLATAQIARTVTFQ